MGASDFLHPAHRREHAAFRRVFFPAPFRFLPVHLSPVQAAAVLLPVRIIVVGIVVELRDLVPAVDHRHPAEGEDEGMQHHIQAQRLLQRLPVSGFHRRLHSAQGGRPAAQPGVPQPGIVVVQLAPGRASLPFPRQVIVQEPLVGNLLLGEAPQEVIVQSPADIVMAADIVQEGIFPGQAEHLLQLVGQQARVLRGRRVPQGGHGGHVVKHVAFRLCHRAEIRCHHAGLHHHFSQQQRPRAYDLAHHPEDPQQRVHLRQIPAGGPQRLPDVGRRVQPDHVHPVVAQVQHIVRHVRQHPGVHVVQIPLVGIESGHHHFPRLRAPGEVPRRGGGKHLRHGLFIRVGNLPVVVEEIPVPVFLLSGPGPPGPLMILAGVVHDKIQAHGDSPSAAVLRQVPQILHGAQLRLHLPEIADGVAPVAAALRALQQGHQVQVVHAALRQVVQLPPHPLQRSREGVHIQLHACSLPPPVPVRSGFPLPVRNPQGFRSFLPEAVQHIGKGIIRLLIRMIQLIVQPAELILVAPETGPELFLPLFLHSVFPPFCGGGCAVLFGLFFLCFIIGAGRRPCQESSAPEGPRSRGLRAPCARFLFPL